MNSNSYDVDQMQYLNDLEHVRKRAGTYIGDLGKAGLHHLVHEVVDNSLDEALAGHATRIDVVVERDQSLSVVDNGRGIPVAFDQRIGVSALEGVMTKLKYGGKFDDTAYSSSGGLNGMGMKAVNFLSEWCLVQVKRDGFLHEQKYQVGVPTGPVRQIKQTTDTGTKISFLPDASKFEVTMFDHELLRTRLQTSLPLISGSMTSRTTRSGRNSLTSIPAPKPLFADLMSNRPSRANTSTINSTKPSLSSTIKILRLPLSKASVGIPFSFMKEYN